MSATKENCDKQHASFSTKNTEYSVSTKNEVEGTVLKILECNSAGLPLDQSAIEKCVDVITKNIREYKSKDDLEPLKNLANLCIEKKLHTEKAKMHRNIAMGYFFTGNTEMAVEMMETAIREFQHQKNHALLNVCYSDLGLIYFCDHEYAKAKELYEKVEALLPSVPDMEKRAIYWHYYRLGLLHSNAREFKTARQYLEKALEYAEASYEIGLAVMNIGIICKRDGENEKAREYYNRALETFEENDYINRSAAYNNLANLYKTIGQFDAALKYINMAFDCLNNRDIVKLFIYFETYTEINVMMGKPEKSIDKFIEMLSNIKDFSVYKSLIIESINSLSIIADESKEMLIRLEAVGIKLIEETTRDNAEYKKELEACLENIRLYIENVDKLNRKGGIIFEKENY